MSGRRPWLLLPLVLYLGAFLVYPTLHALRLAFTDPLTGAFPDLVNFRLLAADRLFRRAVAYNALLPAATVALELVAGVALALLLAARLPGRRLLRAAVVVPFALPEIVFLTVMRYVFAPRGYANAALAALGVSPVDWLLPGRALTVLVVVAVDAWHTTPVVFLMVLAALAAVPAEIGEAARLDGATGVRGFALVTLPLLRPTLLAAVLLRGLDALRVFATPLVLTGVEGVPVLSTYAYHQWSDQGSDAGAAAAATVLATLAVVASVPLLRRRMAA
jgi:ABC-type sugar transport system permease subunit